MTLKDKIYEKIGKNEKKKMGAQENLNDIATGRKNTKMQVKGLFGKTDAGTM